MFGVLAAIFFGADFIVNAYPHWTSFSGLLLLGLVFLALSCISGNPFKR